MLRMWRCCLWHLGRVLLGLLMVVKMLLAGGKGSDVDVVVGSVTRRWL